jgi:hypothetical protein
MTGALARGRRGSPFQLVAVGRRQRAAKACPLPGQSSRAELAAHGWIEYPLRRSIVLIPSAARDPNPETLESSMSEAWLHVPVEDQFAIVLDV